MDRIKFKEILDTIIVPSSMRNEQQEEVVKPLSDFLLQCFPQKLYKYRSCCENILAHFIKIRFG